MTGRKLVVAAALVLLMGACGEADEEPDIGAPPAEDEDGPADAAPGPDDTTAMTPPDPGPAEVELIHGGQDPQTVLRLTPEVGDVTHLRIASDHETSGDAPASAADGPPPVTLALEVVEVGDEWIEASVAITEVSSDDEQLASTLMSVEGTLELDDRGRMHDLGWSIDPDEHADFDPGEPAADGPEPVDDPTMAAVEAFEVLRLLPVFPEEPVGAGGVWTVEQASVLPAPAREMTTVTLEELDEERYTLRTEATYGMWQGWVDWQQQAAEENEEIHPPGLLELDGQGAGEIEGPLDGIAPDRAGRALEITILAESPDGEHFEDTLRIEDRLERD